VVKAAPRDEQTLAGPDHRVLAADVGEAGKLGEVGMLGVNL
jgi:hypothetical protein